MTDSTPGSTPGSPPDGPTGSESRGPEDRSRQRRRLAEVFGDVLPEGTSDEQRDGWGQTKADEPDADDEWLRSQVPPHHG